MKERFLVMQELNKSTYYHGSTQKFDRFNKQINWLTTDYDYAKYYALSTNDEGYIYFCDCSAKNLFDMKNTGYRVFNMFPVTKPFTVSERFLSTIESLELSEEELNKLLEDVQEEWSLNADGYGMKASTVARSIAFKKILVNKGYQGIKAIEYNVNKSRYCHTYGIFNSSDIKIVSVEEVKLNESLQEKKAITWGDLDYAKKTDTRKMMRGRDTGHFGTGFYFVGAEGPYGIKNGKISRDYEPSRPIYEIDLDAYNLYRPADNETAYKLHDALRNINNYYDESLEDWLFRNLNIDNIEDELYELGWKASDLDESVEDDFDDDFDDLSIDDLDDLENEVEVSEKKEKKYRELVKEFVNKYNLLNYISCGYKDFDSWLSDSKSGVIENAIIDAINEKDRCCGYVEYAIEELSKLFSVDNDRIIQIVHDAQNSSSEDSVSTMLMKALGYEGVDVTHLNHDAQGLSGLDNFGYGTVIYDLKSNTFRRIAEPREHKDMHIKECIDSYTFKKYNILEMKGKSQLSNERVSSLIEECCDIMRGLTPQFLSLSQIAKKDISEEILSFDDIEFKEGDALRTFGTFKWPFKDSSAQLILNKHMFEEDDEVIKNTILHELCHYVVFKLGKALNVYRENFKGWVMSKDAQYLWSSHGRIWKDIANIVSNATGNNITTRTNVSNHKEVHDYQDSKIKYVFKCKNCGSEVRLFRRTKFVDTYDKISANNKPLWYCTKCKAGSHVGDEPPFEMIKGEK